MKLLLDEQISGKVAEILNRRGHDLIAVTADPNLRSRCDPEVFAAAQAERRAVVTYNRADFEAIIQEYGARGQDHHGLVIVHPTKLPNRELARLADEIERFLDEFEPYLSFYAWIPSSVSPR